VHHIVVYSEVHADADDLIGPLDSMEYWMEFSLTDTIAVLERTPAVLEALLSDMPAEWVAGNEGEGTWSAIDIVGHLLHGEERDWMERTRIILEMGEARTFDPFDREAFREKYADIELDELILKFTKQRGQNLTELRNLKLTLEMSELSGNHPAFGKVTLKQLLSTWAVHDLSHLAQIARVMAKQYRENVGPWIEYLPILDKR
jgi:hypothetical protein